MCVIVPDATRSCPLPLLLKAVHTALDGRVSRLTILVALGTHAEMSRRAAHRGYTWAADYPNVINHEWWKPDTFADLGTIGADQVGEISDEMLRDEVPVRLNRAVVEHDVALVVGPVFPHEVVGFSGGNKYFFPGVAGQEVIDLSHWLGALITSASIIGTPGITPVRALIDAAAAMIPAEKLALSRRRAVRHRRPARDRVRRPELVVGGGRRRSPRRPTSGTSTTRSSGSCR